jgi:hypothetical protein
VGPTEEPVDGRTLDDASCVHDDDVVRRLGDDAEVVGDDDDRAAELALEPVHQLENLRLRRHVERRRRLVGDQEVGVVDQCHRDHHALAHAARELMRVVVHAAFRLRNADRLEELERPTPRLAGAHVAVELDRLDELAPDRVDRVQRRHRVLEDHRDVVSPDVSQALLRHRQEVLALEECLAARHGVAARVEAHDRQARDALPAARFAHDSERLALLDLEVHAVDGFDDAVVRTEMRLETLDLEQRHMSLRKPDSRIDEGVEQVDDQVEDDHADRREHDDPHYRR